MRAARRRIARRRIDRCGLEPGAGPCDAAIEWWAHDSTANRCRLFVYGGCDGNENNFPNEASGQQTCMNYGSGVL